MKKLHLLSFCMAVAMLFCGFTISAARFVNMNGVQPSSFAGMGNNNEELAYAYYSASNVSPTVTFRLFGAVDYIKRVRIYAIPYDDTASATASGISVSDVKLYDYRDPINKMGAILLAETESISASGVTASLNSEASMVQGKKYMIYLTADLKTADEHGSELPLMKGGTNYTRVGGVIDLIGGSTVASRAISGTGLASASVNTQGTRVIAVKRQLLYSPGDWYSKYYRIPSMTQAADGSLVAISDARKYHIHDIANDIDMLSRHSNDNGATWSDPVTIAKGSGGYAGMSASVCADAKGYGDAALAALPNGDLLCVMVGGEGLGGTDSNRPTTNFYTTSHDNGQTWSALSEIPQDVFLTNRGCIAPGNICVVKSGYLAGKVLACFRSYATITGSRTSSTVGNYLLVYDPATKAWSRLENAKTSTNYTINSNNGTSDDEAHLLEIGTNKFLMSIRTNNSGQNYRAYEYVTLSSATKFTYTAVTSNNPGLSTYCNSDIMQYTDGKSTPSTYMLQCLPCETASDGNENNGVRSGAYFIYTNTLYSGTGSLSWTKSINASDPLSLRAETAQYSSMTRQNDGHIGLLLEEYPNVVRVNDDRGDYYLASWYVDFRIGDLINGAVTPTIVQLVPPTITPGNSSYVQPTATDRPAVTISHTNTSISGVNTYYQFEYYATSTAQPVVSSMTWFTGASKSFTWSELCTALGITDAAIGSYIKVLAKCSATGYETSTTTSVIYNFKNQTRKIRVVSMPTSGLGNITLSSTNVGSVGENQTLTVGEGDMVTINAPAKSFCTFMNFSYSSTNVSDLNQALSYTEMNDLGYQIQFPVPAATALGNNVGDELVIYVFYKSNGGLYSKVTLPVKIPNSSLNEFSKWWSATSTDDNDVAVKGDAAPDDVPVAGTRFGAPTITDNVAIPKYDNEVLNPAAGFLHYYQDQVDSKAVTISTLELMPGVNASQGLNCVVMTKIGNQWVMKSDGTISYSLYNGRNYSYPTNSALYTNARVKGTWYADATTPKLVTIGEYPMLTPTNFDTYMGGALGYPNIEITVFVVSNNLTSVTPLTQGTGYLFKVVHPLSFLAGVATGVEQVGSEANGLIIGRVDGGANFMSANPMSVTIVDMLGRMVKKFDLNGDKMISLPKGVYIANGKKFIVM